MMQAFQDLFERLGLRRSARRYAYALDADLHAALLKQVDGDRKKALQLAGELLNYSLAQMRSNDVLKERWQELSRRQQEITALTCLGYTNRQIAARLSISPETVKTHVKNTLSKFQMKGKLELQKALKEWDFSKWDPE